MIKKVVALAAAVSTLAAPSMAASIHAAPELGERRSAAAAGMYLSFPFGGERSGRPQAGLRLQMSHDYRNASAQAAPVVRANVFDLRWLGEREATVYIADLPVTGEEARKHNLTGVSTLVTVAILAAAAVGAVVIYNALNDDDDDDERQCLLPEGCP